MTTTPISLQDLRRRIFKKAKAEPQWRFWGLYVHVCKVSTLREAYRLAKRNNGSPGVDGISFDDLEAAGLEQFFADLSQELQNRTYRPSRVRKVEIPKGNGKVRVLSVPTIRDRVVQGSLKLILEPIFEPDFQPGSYGYRPGRSATGAVRTAAQAIAHGKTQVIDIDLKAYFDSVRQDIVLSKVARRVNDPDVLKLLKMIMRTSGRRGVPQGGVISPLLSNVYLNEVDKMLEKAKSVTRHGKVWTAIEYVRYADDLVVLISGHPQRRPLVGQVLRRLREEFKRIGVVVNEEKTRVVDLTRGDSFDTLGFTFRRVKSRRDKWMPLCTPQVKKRTALFRRLREVFRRYRSQPVMRVIQLINPILRGWVNYFAEGNSGKCFNHVRDWVEKKIRRHMMRARKRRGFGWQRWRREFLYDTLGLFGDYRVRVRYSRQELPINGP